MKIKSYFQAMSMALAMAFALTGCGDDDPILPTPDDPDPVDPDPTPEVVYDGHAFYFQLDSVAGDAEAFNTMVLDTMSLYFPEMKEVGTGLYAASLVHEQGDTANVAKLRAEYREFVSHMVYMCRDAKQPVVTTMMTFGTQSESNVKEGWSFSSGTSSGSSQFGVLIPALRNEEWKTADDKGTGVQSIAFGDAWLHSKTVKAMFNTSQVVVGDTSYPASRQGQFILLFDENDQIKYGFYIDPAGDALYLVRVGENTLEGEAVPTYSVVAE